MASTNLKDATRELVDQASTILHKATTVRKGADSLLDALKKIDAELNRQREEQVNRRKREEQLKVQSAHTKAFTMLDDDEKAQLEAARQQDLQMKQEKQAEKAKVAEAAAEKVTPPQAREQKAAAAEKKPEVQAEVKPEVKAEAKVEVKAEAKVEAKVEAKAEAKVDAKTEVKAEAKTEARPEKKAENKNENKPEAKNDAKPEAKPEGKNAAKGEAKAEGKAEHKEGAKADAKPDAKLDVKPEAKSERKDGVRNDARNDAKAEKKPEAKADAKTETKAEAKTEGKTENKTENKSEARPEKKSRPAIGQIMSRPGDEPLVPAKPVGLAPNVIRPPRPAAPGAQQQQRGSFGRPANAAAGTAAGTNAQQPRGPYGRPANPQQGQGGFARPAGAAQQGQGGFGRPANGQQGQGGFGRPANGQQQGQGGFGRPANGQQGQGGFGRPANGQQGQGGFGRPAGAQQGQGGFGRPANGQQGQGGFKRNDNGDRQGGFGRPAGGAQGRNAQGGQRSNRVASSAGGVDLTPMEKERVSNYDPNKKNYIRQHDPEHVARNRKQASKNSDFNGYDDEVIRGGKRARAKKPSAQQMMAPIKIESAVMAGDTITVRDLTEKIGKPAGEIIKKLFMLGTMATINSEIDFDTAQLVCSDFDITLEKKVEQSAEEALVAEDFEDTEDALQTRPPVVTIMGHVDHGKTSLLDYIRKSSVTTGEAGGITQHIGAYTVKVQDGRQITFLDTPGHEAFTAMRARGTQATDIAVLVVAADDSVMPQTIESINHAKAADVPIIVAINKMDKPEANPERVKQDLTAHGLVCEDWGGETICVPVSAKTGEGVEDLLEMILLQADMLQLQANPDRLGRGVIIEAKLDKARGPLATVLLQNGTLHVGDSIIAGMASGKVRALINDKGERVNEAGPSMPVEIMGFDDVPSAGDEMIAVGDDHLSRQVADERREKLRASREASMAKLSMENLFSTIEAGKVTTLNLIIKADVQGSVEAVKQAMEKLSTDEVKIRVLHSAAGAITQDDVNLASAFNAIIIGFNIRPDASAREAAEKAKVDVRLYTIIYKAIEDMELAMKGLLAPEYKEVLLGHAEVRNVFKITGAGIIAGCYVTDGKVQRNAQVRLLRENVVVHEGKLSSLRHLKDDVKEMAAGYECGMSLEGHNDIQIGDVVECFIMEEIQR